MDVPGSCVAGICALLCALAIAASAVSPPRRADVPVGGEDQSTVLQLVGEKREAGFTPKDHLQLGEELDLIDFETAGTVSAGTGQRAYLGGAIWLVAADGMATRCGAC